MKPITIKPVKKLRGTVTLPGDKSISHRAAILAALACGKTEIENFLFSDDCLITLNALGSLGIKIQIKKNRNSVLIDSAGYLAAPKMPLFMGESGTSARLFLGLLAGQNFASTVTAAPSLTKRPMARVIEPLTEMGAKIQARKRGSENFLPAEILSSRLRGVEWMQKIPSAQVKSSILLAGLFASGETVVREPVQTRDHTERMLKLFGADIRINKGEVRVSKCSLKSPKNIVIPGDISSAVFFIVAALLVKDSKIVIKDVSVNPTRMGAVHCLQRMGGCIKVLNKKDFFEPLADMEVLSSRLQATIIEESEIPSLIDELPILMVAASLAVGITRIEGVSELRVKETDRIRSMCKNLTELGVNIKVKSQGKKETIEISGVSALKAGKLRSFSDHRTAMSMVVAGFACIKPSSLDDGDCIKKSFPDFLTTLRQLFAR